MWGWPYRAGYPSSLCSPCNEGCCQHADTRGWSTTSSGGCFSNTKLSEGPTKGIIHKKSYKNIKENKQFLEFHILYNSTNKIPGENPPNGTGASHRVSMVEIWVFYKIFYESRFTALDLQKPNLLTKSHGGVFYMFFSVKKVLWGISHFI